MTKEACENENNVKFMENGIEYIRNCRNIWFREFWAQHHKCSFNDTAKVRCTGKEKSTSYEQEGLVPFVGKNFILFLKVRKFRQLLI